MLIGGVAIERSAGATDDAEGQAQARFDARSVEGIGEQTKTGGRTQIPVHAPIDLRRRRAHRHAR